MLIEKKFLNQAQLKNLYDLQQQGNWEKIQNVQLKLKATLLHNYKTNWKKYKRHHKEIKPVFDLKNKEAQEFTITKKTAEQYYLKSHLKEFLEKSRNSTGGIRSFVDIENSLNPQKMYNDLFLGVLIQAEAEFLKNIHKKEIKKKLENVNIVEFCKKIRKQISKENIKIIEDIFKLKLEDIIAFIKENPVKLVGGEVRPHTPKFIEMECRILAQNGIKVICFGKYTDTTTIYIFSYLTYLLGSTGATYYSSSHSSNYLAGRKVLASDGSQILAEVYENYRIILDRIINKEINSTNGYKLKMSKSNHRNILKNLSYKKIAKLYVSILNITKNDIDIINKATSKGHKIIINALNGCTAKTLKQILQELGINLNAFDWLYEEEDGFFNVGYVVVSSYDKDKKKYIYNVDHFGIDTSVFQTINTIPYRKLLKNKPVGMKIYECDPDSDRLVLKQIMDKKNIGLLDNYGIEYYNLDDDKILAAPSSNKVFLCLDIVDYELMKEKGIWNKYNWLYLITYASSKSWIEFADSVENLKKIIALVGFKNLTEMQKKIEKWYFNSNNSEFNLKDQLGNEIMLNRKKPIRIFSKEEESGGRVAGMNKICFNILGQKTIAMPEKSAADSLISELIFSSKLYLQDDKNYIIANFIDSAFKKYKIKSKIDFRLDIFHGTDQGIIAQMEYAGQQAEMKKAYKIKMNFNNFFFSIARQVKDKNINMQKAIEILIAAIPEYKDTWICLDKIILTEELLANNKKRNEGIIMSFRQKNNNIPIVTELDFRPSGTDPLKSKIYVDAMNIKKKQIIELKNSFENFSKKL
ncbi:MAG: hypothetical protein B6U87_02500 [Candidatus Aenigmarchaeota archaeon ex4484_52]|nr:MAG: hypothetical protein B6U87_02500 [Candidatus Aenigmarchaeota archaeon ex4484_52]